MATRYYSFNIFMDDVIKAANQRVNLEELFALKNSDISSIISKVIVQGGWPFFITLVALLLLGPFAFSAALIGFGVTPVGITLILIFGGIAIPTVKTLYQDRELPLAVKEVGEEFLPKWKEVEGDQAKIDNLLSTASSALIRKASISQRRLLGLE